MSPCDQQGSPSHQEKNRRRDIFIARKQSGSTHRTQPNSDPRKLHFICHDLWSLLDERRNPQRQQQGPATFRGWEGSHRGCIAEQMTERGRLPHF